MRPKFEQMGLGERRLVALLAFVQFVNILDFMMVMPLGPDFSADLGIPTSKLGIVGGSYTAAAAVSGLVSAMILDRFPRKKALITVVTGLSLATFAGALSNGLTSLLAARVLAGCFGGPASALALAIVADSIPVARRGRALGVVMGAFSIASIFGVPVGLELAHLGSWRTPFIGVGALALIAAAGIHLLMDEPATHQRGPALTPRKLMSQFRKKDHLIALALGATVMFSGFIVIPNIAAFVQKNLGLPREDLGFMYMAGGLASLISMQIAGRITDRVGSMATTAFGTAVLLTALIFGFAHHEPSFTPVVIATLFMTGTSIRAISFNTLTSRVPQANERGAFMSVQSTIQHISSATGAFVSSRLLTSDTDGKLIGMETVAWISVAFSLCVPALIWTLEQHLAKRDASKQQGATRS